MSFVGDERAQSVQIGAVLLFAVLVIAFSSYQAFVIPNQNQEIEFNHNQQVQSQMQDLRNAIVSIHGETATRSVTLTLGTRYPSRLLGMNPGPPSGAIRTAGTTRSTVNISIENATATGETGDVWNGTQRTYLTGDIVYQPNYNRYTGAPRTVYENSVLYNQFRSGNLTASDQTLIDGERIRIVTVNGSMSRTETGSTSLDLRPVSTSTRTVSVSDTPAGGNVTLFVPTRLSKSQWGDLLDSQVVSNGGHVVDYDVQPVANEPFDRLRIDLESDVSYDLRMTKVGIGRNVSSESATYLTDVGDSNPTVQTGETADIIVEARDAYNNPVGDTNVNASASVGTMSPSAGRTDDDGRLRLEYDSSGVSPGTYDVNVSLDAVGGGFDGATGENVTIPVTVTAAESSGTGDEQPYNIRWDTATIDGEPTIEYFAGNDTAVVSGGSEETVNVTSRVNTTDGDGISGVTVDYATRDPAVADFPTLEGQTGADGRSTVPMSVGIGSTTVYSAATVGSDSLTVKGQRGGVYYRYYEGQYGGYGDYMPTFGSQTPVESGTVSTFDIGPRNRDDHFGFNYTAYIEIPADGEYTFYTNSDDGSRLWIDGTRVVNNPGDHVAEEQSGQITLSEGRHNITVAYYENEGEEVFSTSWAGPGFGKEEIPSSVLEPREPAEDGSSGGGGSGNGSGGGAATVFSTTTLTDNTGSNGKNTDFDLSYTTNNTNFDEVRVTVERQDGSGSPQTFTSTQQSDTFDYTDTNSNRKTYSVTYEVRTGGTTENSVQKTKQSGK